MLFRVFKGRRDEYLNEFLAHSIFDFEIIQGPCNIVITISTVSGRVIGESGQLSPGFEMKNV